MNKIQGLDDKFWVWETLEEAVRPEFESLTKEQIVQFSSAWHINLKGSDDLYDLMHERIAYHFADAPPFMTQQ